MHPTATRLIDELRALDVHLRVEDGRLRVNAPKGRLTPALEAELVAQKEALVEVLREQPAGMQRTILAPVSRSEPLRLSFLQERLWVLDRLQPGQTTYNLAASSDEIDGIQIPVLLKAIRRVVERHEILRTRFALDGDSPRVQVADAGETRIELRDLRALDPESRAALLRRAAPDATHEPFDLSAEAPARFTVLQTGDTRGAFLVSAHHIALDSWSLGVLLGEVRLEYQALVAESTELRPPLQLQYVDYAHWQRESAAQDGSQERLQYWTERLASLPQLSTFPTDHTRRMDAVGTGAAFDFSYSHGLTADVRAMARELDATVYMVLLAAVAVVLTRNAAQTDVAIGSPVGTRDVAELEGMLGPILNPLVLRFDVGDDPSFAELVGRARDGVLDGHANQDVPFEALVQALNPQRSLGHSPLFQVAVVLHNAPDAASTQIHGGGAIYDLTVFGLERDGVLCGSFEYRSDLYDPATIERLSAQLEAVLSAAVRDHQQRVSSIPLLVEPDARALIAATNPAPVAVDSATVVAQFARIAEGQSGRIAVSASDGDLTYAEVDRRSALVAEALRAIGAGRGSYVALATDRSSAMVVGALGILKSGAAYVPIDVSYPADRVAFMLHDSGARHIVSTRASIDALRGVAAASDVVLVDDVVAAAPVAVPGSIPESIGADDIAYLMYTSGSTGTPKGVLVPHGAVSSFLGAMRIRPGIAADDAVLCVTSMAFDISVLEVFLPLVTGARTILATREVASDGERLADLIRTSRATIVQSTPSGWRLLMQAKWSGSPEVTAIAGGEPMPDDLTRWLGERVRWVWNGYGPTETTVYSSMALLTGADMITIGTPVSNTHIYVLDALNHPLPVGVPGEICIGGNGVTRGYHDRPALTGERFVPDPFVAGARMYRTGDYGRWRADGRLEHLGRIDGQVKVRGYRIETGEIETALTRHPAVHAAVVGVRNAATDDPRLVAWVQLEPHGDCTTSELRRHLRSSLPEFMIPSMLVLVESFPMTPNGKVDKRALADPFAAGKPSSQEYIAPTTPAELLIADVWMRLLGVTQVGTTDSFFELGGHSLLAMRAAQEISAATGVPIEPRLLFFRTLGQLAAASEMPAPVGAGRP